MANEDIPIKDTTPLEKTRLGTLCLLTRVNQFGEKEYLLGMHTKQKLWNGIGGKVGDKPEFKDESIEDSIKREATEELSVNLINLTKKGIAEFTSHKNGVAQTVEMHIFLCDLWEGEMKGNGELTNFAWFTKEEIPWDYMWKSDRPWLERVIEDREGEFLTIKVDFIDDSTPRKIEISSNYDERGMEQEKI